jgi:hypothetical protein
MHRHIPDLNKHSSLLQQGPAEKVVRLSVPALINRPGIERFKFKRYYEVMQEKEEKIACKRKLAHSSKPQKKAKLRHTPAKQQEIDTLKQLVSTQRQKIQDLLEELKQKNKGALKQTLFEKVVSSDECKEYLHNHAVGTDVYETKKSAYEYNQNVLLQKINKYHASVGKPPTSNIGHCHGITLLWLMMMSLDLEPLFYKMAKDISECPDGKLHTIHKKITTFLEWIDLGQNPQNYSNNTYQQRDVEHIIGGVTVVAAIKKNIVKADLPEELRKVTQENNMICFAGKDPDAAPHQAGGHAIGVFVRKTPSGNFNYCIYDSNYTDNKHKVFASSVKAAAECWACTFSSTTQTPLRSIEIDVVRPLSVTQKSFITSIIPTTQVLAATKGFQRVSLFGNSSHTDRVVKLPITHVPFTSHRF